MTERANSSSESWRLPPPPADVRSAPAALGQSAARSLGTPLDFRSGRMPPRDQPAAAPQPVPASDPATDGQPSGPRKQATETIARRAGALSDEIDFPDFVAGLVHGTFDAIVDASIRQMESFAGLVSAIAKTVEEFTEENVTSNQARDWLVHQYPQDLYLDLSETPKVLPKPAQGEDADQPKSPAWLADFHVDGEELTPELIEETLVPAARKQVGHARQQTLATMVLLGMNRIVVRDGSISARLRFRAAAADKSKVDYAVSDDPGSGSNWGTRGDPNYQLPSTKVSTVGVNVQSDAQLNAELFGEVKINFASETLPLDRFVDEAKRTLLEKRAKHAPPATPAPAATPAAPPTTTPALPLPTAPPPAAAPATAGSPT